MNISNTKAVAGAFGIALSIAATNAFAQAAPKWYAGLAVGGSHFKEACDGVPGTVSCDDKGTAAKVFAGYQFHPNWAAELTYTDFGKATLNGTVGVVGVTGTGKGYAGDISAVGSLPVGSQFSVYGRVGVYWAHSAVSATARAGGFTATASGTDNNSGGVLGVGATYDFTKTLQARAEWQKFSKVGGDNTGGKSDVDVVSVGLAVKF